MEDSGNKKKIVWKNRREVKDSCLGKYVWCGLGIDIDTKMGSLLAIPLDTVCNGTTVAPKHTYLKFKIIIHFASVDFTLFTVDLVVVVPLDSFLFFSFSSSFTCHLVRVEAVFMYTFYSYLWDITSKRCIVWLEFLFLFFPGVRVFGWKVCAFSSFPMDQVFGATKRKVHAFIVASFFLWGS